MKTRLSALALALLLGGGMASAQKILVTGRVTNASNAVLPKAQVVVKETGRSMTTTEQGLYVIELESGQTLQSSSTVRSSRLSWRISTGGCGAPRAMPQSRGSLRPTPPLRTRATGKDDVILSTSSRGATSITGKARPLWVLNGVVLGSDYGSLESFAGADPKQVGCRSRARSEC